MMVGNSYWGVFSGVKGLRMDISLEIETELKSSH